MNLEIEEQILNLYFVDKLKQKEIATKLNISKYKVSRTVSNDNRYSEEKIRRKEINKKKHNEDSKKRVREARNRKNALLEYDNLKRDHIQASIELSAGNKTINNRAFRDWNLSAYEYDKKTKSYILKKEIVTGSDVPKRISWKLK